ncbi:MAG: SCO family protein [Actinomycetia bacterium]|nr:SCO family protein [Actinomycetes bacterium]
MKRALIPVLIALALVASACGSDDPEPAVLAGIQRIPLPDVGELALPTTTGTDLAMQADEDGLLLVYFGYTSCPDVCPTTMSDIRMALRELGDDAERISVAMATVDPNRDTDDILDGYVKAFVDDGIALRTEDDSLLRASADVFGVTYSVAESEEGEIEVTHSGFLYAVDDQGLLQVTWPFGTPADDILSDLEILLDQETT